jgi:Flp pilus assembly protein TadG
MTVAAASAYLLRAPQRAAGARRRAGARRGAAVVEFAVVAPVLFLLLFGFIEFGRAVMVQQVLVNGAREGARRAMLPGATADEVADTVETYMSSCGLTGYTVTVTPNPASATPGQAITVTVSVPYERVSWIPAQWLTDSTLAGSAVMRKEGY